jgi:hypothetical protein
MREAWGLDHNPFPAGAIAGEDSDNAPYDPDLLVSDHNLFVEKLIVKAILPPGREFGYLWSQGRRDDTGFGKTTIMLRAARDINSDFGAAIASKYELLDSPSIAAVWASMKTTGVTGIYALLFNTIVYAAKRPSSEESSLVEKCWVKIAEQGNIAADDKNALKEYIGEKMSLTHHNLFPGYPALRDDIVEGLVSCDPAQLLNKLEKVTSAGRSRNGLSYFEAFYTLVRAAGVEHLFVFVDQLEDLATAKNVPRATRQREVGRFRDIFAEASGFRGHCHAVFTLHNRAAQALADFWQLERLNPPFWPQDPMGRPATVVVAGLTSIQQVERLLVTYLDSVRTSPTGTAEPFEPSTFQVLLDRCDGRIGQLLPEAYAILEQAAEAQLPTISSQYILENMPVQMEPSAAAETASDQDTLSALWNANP